MTAIMAIVEDEREDAVLHFTSKMTKKFDQLPVFLSTMILSLSRSLILRSSVMENMGSVSIMSVTSSGLNFVTKELPGSGLLVSSTWIRPWMIES